MSGSKHTNRVERLERMTAKRVKPLELDAKPTTPTPGEQARRRAVLAQLAEQLLFGTPAESQPYPSVALHPRAAALFRAKALNTREFQALEQQVAGDKAAGPRIFGADWKHSRWCLAANLRSRSACRSSRSIMSPGGASAG